MNETTTATAAIARKLRETRIFSNVAVADLERVITQMRTETHVAGNHLFRKGDSGDSMYILIGGKLRFYTTDANNKELTLSYYEPVRLFGEFSLLDKRARSASVIALENCDVLTMTRDEFTQLLPDVRGLGMAMMKSLADRVRHMTRYLNSINSITRLLSAGQFDLALAEVAETARSAEGNDLQGLVEAYQGMIAQLQATQASDQPAIRSPFDEE